MAHKLPVGISDFAKVISDDYHYIDKTLLVEEVLETSAEAILISRPRRFGKSLNFSMLNYFFNNKLQGGSLFNGLNIEQRACFEQQGTFPTISLSFHRFKPEDYPTFLGLFRNTMSTLYREHGYMLEGLNDFDQADFQTIANGTDDKALLIDALARLIEMLHNYHGKRVILLIDEYDTPIQASFENGYYEQVVRFFRGTFAGALKDNKYLEKAVLTGILRVAKESVFSDLNNVAVYSVLNGDFADKFGFTEAETNNLLELCGLRDKMEEVQDWYNGYMIGGTVIYNPWSILQFIASSDRVFRPYWVNTSSNKLVRDQLLNASSDTQMNLETLLSQGQIETMIDEHVALRDLSWEGHLLWSFLLFSGYLTVAEKRMREEQELYSLKIPNKEVMFLFRDIIRQFFHRHVGESSMGKMERALVGGDVAQLEHCLSEFVAGILSYYDTAGKTPERVYHAFILGLLAHMSGRYSIRSNRESGLGRYDVLMLPLRQNDPGVVLEFKVANKETGLTSALDKALAQIQDRRYTSELKSAGVQRYFQIAVAFCGKVVRVKRAD